MDRTSAVPGRVSDPGSAWFGGGERSSSAGPGRNVRLIATAVAAFVSVLGLALFLHLYVCHVRRRNRRRAAEAAALATANAGRRPSRSGWTVGHRGAADRGVREGAGGDAAGGTTECAICPAPCRRRTRCACCRPAATCSTSPASTSGSRPARRARSAAPGGAAAASVNGGGEVRHEKQDAEKEEAAAGSSAPVRVLGASLMKMLSRERPSPRRQPGVHAVEMEDLESQLPRPQQQ